MKAAKTLAKAIVKEIPLGEIKLILAKRGKDLGKAAAGDICGIGCPHSGDWCGLSCPKGIDFGNGRIDPAGHLGLTATDLRKIRSDVGQLRAEISDELANYAKQLQDIK